MDFARKIKEIRLHNFLSQEEFAKVLGVSYATVYRWESGRTIPNIRAMNKIDEYCKTEHINYDIRDWTQTDK